MIVRKIIIIFIFSLSIITVRAQLDLEHWFPPFFQSVSGTAISEIKIYLSTDKIKPFKINIYNHNVIVDTVILSNSKPIEYTLKDDTMIRTNLERKTMTRLGMGFYIAGEQSFYASLRMQDTYSEIIASKGKSALGKEFYVVNDQVILYEDPTLPLSSQNAVKMNYQASILATKDNTHIKIFNYNKNLVFADGSTDDILSITLNRGESYILAALKIDNKSPNRPHPVLDDNDPNLIGAKIVSDEPIVVNNGNFLSQDLGEAAGNINLDQSVPTTKLGKEYFVVNGMTVAESAMEKVIIVATKDNTKVYFNDETNSTVSLNEGQYFIGPYPNKFKIGNEQTFVNTEPKQIPTKGMYIRASNPIYLYQMIGGFNDMPRGPALPKIERTSGMTFSYPLDIDYLPHEKPNLIQVPFINKIGKFTNDVKLTIKSPENAKIYLNGSLLGSGSPMIGKPGWKYHTYPYLSSNPEIQSDKSLNIDAVGGTAYTGFASSYTGFSHDPYIAKNGTCIQESVILNVSNKDFEIIQWQLNGADILGANSQTYIPTTPGNYRCKLTYAYGDFNYYTNEIFIDNCPYQITEKNLENICANKQFIISPQFSPPYAKYDIIKTEILTPPYLGSAQLNDIDIIVKIDKDFSGENRIIYKITSSNGFYEIVNAKFRIYSLPNPIIVSPIDPIGINNNKYIYNLNDALVLTNNHAVTYKFFNSENDALNNLNEIKKPNTYITIQKHLYVKAINANNCFSVFELKLNQPGLPPTSEPDSTVFPNTFTPNDDGYNDVWSFELLEDYTNLQVIIFDKQGSKVYEYSKGKPFYWDGRNFSGAKLPTGVYWVILKGINPDKNEILNKSQWLYLKNRN